MSEQNCLPGTGVFSAKTRTDNNKNPTAHSYARLCSTLQNKEPGVPSCLAEDSTTLCNWWWCGASVILKLTRGAYE
jgi:hypothetical protein